MRKKVLLNHYLSGAGFDLILDSAHFTGGLPSSDTAATAGNSSHSLLLLPGRGGRCLLFLNDAMF